MASTSRRRSAICLAAIVGLCLSLSEQLRCEAFLTSAPAAARGSTSPTSAHPASEGCASIRTRSAVRSRRGSRSRVLSAVEDVERVAAVGDKPHAWTSNTRERVWEEEIVSFQVQNPAVKGSAPTRETVAHKLVKCLGTAVKLSSTVSLPLSGTACCGDESGWLTLPLGLIDPDVVLFRTTAASAAVASAPPETDSAADVAAAVFDTPFAVPAEEPVSSSQSPKELGEGRKRIKKARRKAGKAPVVVEGDDLANTPKMIALVWSSLALNALYLLQAFLAVESPVEALGTAAAGAFVGYLIADLWSGLLHWSLDNYGSGATPAFGAIIESFQGHHASPWTITHRPFENNVHKVTYAALPLLALLRLADPGLFGVALGVAFLYGSLMSNEFHKYSHMLDPPPMAKVLQGMGLSISRKQHGRHHSGTFDEKYCLVSGICNGVMDDFRVFRFLERVVYQTNGVEPIAWRLDPSLKQVALTTGWWPFESARVEDAAAVEEAGGGDSA